MSDPIQVYPKEGNGSFPTLAISPLVLMKVVRSKLQNRKIIVNDVRLNGSGASFCLAEDREKEPRPHYNDLDIIFKIELNSEHDLHVIKDEVLNSLYQFFPEGTQTDRISPFVLEECYVKKRVKVSNMNNVWSLISLGGDTGINIELKFVSVMKRQYEFSVDSFQIILDPLLYFNSPATESIEISPHFYPHVQAISLYDFDKAIRHLNNRLIATHNPEEIRGGGLLKYCCLLVTGYKPDNAHETEAQEPYMCSRFFIDFPHMNAQFSKIYKYISTRFLPTSPEKGLDFLDTLVNIVANKAKCLMESERYKTMGVIQHLRANLLWTYDPVYKFHFYQQSQQALSHHAFYRSSQQQQSSNPPPRLCRLTKSPSPPEPTGSTHKIVSTATSTTPTTASQHLINFPHTHNNAVPIGPTPTPVR